MKHQRGFTVIEIAVAIVFVGAAALLLLLQKGNLEAARRDEDRKVAINAMYYNLEEVFYEKNGFYPSEIDSKTLRAMDPQLFTDPRGIKMGDEGANYRYEGLNCNNDTCKSYKLTSSMEKEAEYVKTSRNK
ncbi:MAG TPA: prepilin-type N-terminal cleavage/methylation domain-containing protein [Candidatus Saccharimonadales bacterium]|nr:prepilin-type N-terminal cleavage/methylation domain-containing protein [Candidatus Saccharimonadales bacterium]